MNDLPGRDSMSEPTGLYSYMQTLVQQQQQQATTIAIIQHELLELKREAVNLNKILLEGNGRPSLTVASALMEENIRSIANTLNSLRTAFDVRSSEDTKGKWGIMLAVITSLIAASAVIWTALIGKK